MKQINLSQGKVALVDDADFEWLSAWKWHAVKRDGGLRFYAARNDWCGGKNQKVYMHRALLARIKEDECVDHRNGNGLDNQRCNLRPATPTENQQNRRGRSNSKSGVKGALANGKRYTAKISVNGHRRYLGSFASAEDAGAAYAAAANTFFGEFAYREVMS